MSEDDYVDEPPAPRHSRREQAPRPDDLDPGSFRNSGFFQGGPAPPPMPSNPLLREAQLSPPDYRSLREVTRPATPPGRRAAQFVLAAVVGVVLLGSGYAGYAGIRWFQHRQAAMTASGEPATAVEGEAPAAAPAGATPGNGRAVAQLGVTVRDGSFAFKVTRVRDTGTVLLSSGAGAVKAEGRFVLVEVTVKNLGGTPRSLRPTQQLLQDSATNTYPARTAIRLATVRRLWAAIGPGAAVRGTLVFDVPKSRTISDLLLQGGATSPGLNLSVP